MRLHYMLIIFFGRLVCYSRPFPLLQSLSIGKRERGVKKDFEGIERKGMHEINVLTY